MGGKYISPIGILVMAECLYLRFFLIKLLVRMSGSLNYQPIEIQKALEHHVRCFSLLLSENISSESMVVVKEGFVMHRSTVK